MRPRTCSHTSVRTRICPAMFFSPFSPRGGAPEQEHFFWRPPPFPAVKPRPSSRNPKLLWRTKNWAHLDAGCVRRSEASVHGAECMYIGVVMWCGEGGVLTTKTEEGESGDIREGGVASDRLKIRQNQLKARKSRQSQVYLSSSSQKTGTMWGRPIAGSWRAICIILGFRMYLFLAPKWPGIPVFGKNALIF